MGRTLSYSNLLKTYKTRGYRLNHLENYKYLFPLELSPKLAGIVADLIGDGHLQGDPKWRIDFTSKDVGELKRFEKDFKQVFNIGGKIRNCDSNIRGKTYNLGINCSPVARLLNLCGVPSGQKVLIKFKTPNWIKEDKEGFKRFCQRLFTCEGAVVYEEKRKFPQIRLEMWKNEKIEKDGEAFLREISNLMKRYFNVDSKVIIQNRKNIRKDRVVTKPIRLYILGESVLKFYEEIGFEGSKQQSLKALISKLNKRSQSL